MISPTARFVAASAICECSVAWVVKGSSVASSVTIAAYQL